MEQIRLATDRTVEVLLHPGQRRALSSRKRFVLVLAGWQSGKTVIGPPWLLDEIKASGPGDYLVACPTYPLMQKKVLPEFLRLFGRLFRLGKFTAGKNVFTFSSDGCRRLFGRNAADPVQVFFGHTQDPDSLESATYRGAWLDECGQKTFRLESHEAIVGRLSIHQGRILYTTRPYTLGWLKQQLYDPWEAVGRNHPTIDVVSFRSIDNPAFPRAEYERARRLLPAWKFLMKYDGRFTRPAGVIYDNFDPHQSVVPRFALPDYWPRYLGLDFGGVNTAGVFYAREPSTGRLYAYREYHAGGRTAAQHVAALLAGEPMVPGAAGGSKSEGQWRDEFAAAGLPVAEPAVSDVEVGINRVYAAHARGLIYVFSDLTEYLDQKASYAREVDDAGEPTEKIEAKDTYHLLDAERYILGHLMAPEEAESETTWERV